MEDEKNISILFDLKAPTDYRHSTINTIVLLLREIANMEDFVSFDEIDIAVLNENIERMKKELDNLKIIKFEE